MNKKILAILCAVALMLTLLVGCGGSSAAMKDSAATIIAPSEPSMAPSLPSGGNLKPEASYDSALGMDYVKGEAMKPTDGTAEIPEAQQKLIYTAYLEMESTSFDETVEALTALTRQHGGYFSNSSVRNYNSGYRSASYTIRIPADQYEAFLTQAGELCHVLHRNSSAEDVSEQYYDTEGRLKTQQTKLDRLQELLKQAKNMEDIITIESAISETEMQIEYLSGTLRRYDALVDYATVNLQLQEVYRLANTEEPVKGFGSRFVTALKSGWANFVDDMEDFLVDLAYSWMWLVIWAVIIFVVVRVVVRRRKNGKSCRLFRRKEKNPESGDQTEKL